MKKIELIQNKITDIPWAIIVAFFIGMLMVAGVKGRIIAVSLTLVLPLLFYIAQKPFSYILKLMLVVIFFIPFPFYDFLNLFKILNPLVILGIVLGLKLFWSHSIQEVPGQRNFTAIDKIYFVFLLSAFISSLHAISLLGALNWILYSVTTGYLVYRALLTLNSREVKNIVKFAVFVASLSALYGIGEYIAAYSLIYGRSIPERLTSLLGHPVINGLVFATVLPFSLTLFLETRKKIFIVTTTVLLLAIVLTFARGSWLALAIGFLTLFSFFRSHLKLRVIIVSVVLLVLIGSVPAVQQAVLRRLNRGESDRYSSFNIRRQSFPIAFSIIQDKLLFGGGPFNADRYKDQYAIDSNLKGLSFENTYLALLVDLGLVGAGLLFLLVLIIAKRIFFSPWAAQEGDIYRSAGLASFVILLVNMGTFNFDSYRLFHFVIWFLSGLALTFSTGSQQGNLRKSNA